MRHFVSSNICSMSTLQQLLCHPMTRHMLCLLLWAGLSLSTLLVNRVLMHYSNFTMPCFLALLSAAGAAAMARVLVYLLQLPDAVISQGTWRLWCQLGLFGAVMGASAAFSNAALLHLDIPTFVLLQAAAPAVSYWLAILMAQEEVHWSCVSKAVLVCCGVALAIWPDRHTISSAGLSMLALSVFLDVLWRRLLLRNMQGFAKDLLQHASPLVLLANTAPASMLVLALPTVFGDGQNILANVYRWRPELPLAAVACVLATGLSLCVFESSPLRSLSTEPSGQAAFVIRDVLSVLLAAKFLNEHWGSMQLTGYIVAQLAGFALCFGRAGGGCLRSRAKLCSEDGPSNGEVQKAWQEV